MQSRRIRWRDRSQLLLVCNEGMKQNIKAQRGRCERIGMVRLRRRRRGRSLGGWSSYHLAKQSWLPVAAIQAYALAGRCTPRAYKAIWIREAKFLPQAKVAQRLSRLSGNCREIRPVHGLTIHLRFTRKAEGFLWQGCVSGNQAEGDLGEVPPLAHRQQMSTITAAVATATGGRGQHQFKLGNSWRWAAQVKGSQLFQHSARLCSPWAAQKITQASMPTYQFFLQKFQKGMMEGNLQDWRNRLQRARGWRILF